jgi:hypothetical protein
MSASQRAFDDAWLMLKSQPVGMSFTKSQKDKIVHTIVKMMQSDNPEMIEKATELYNLYNNSFDITLN